MLSAEGGSFAVNTTTVNYIIFYLVDYDTLLELNAKAAEEMRVKEEEEDEQLVQ